MSKIKLTKGELKRQRDSLRRFLYYLPTLQLKKQQLQKKISEAHKILSDLENRLKKSEENISRWVGLLADERVDIVPFIKPVDILWDMVNIAGANLPFLKDVRFSEMNYDFFTTPLWVDEGIKELRALIRQLIEAAIMKKQIAILEKELRITTQRVNLFEKVKIPECLEFIRIIRIYLGDQQANAVGISKVAKKKIELALV
ncbi:MAG TPA: V-type ATP synthase subunit D [Candidatus Omnitrophota bacterium]|nr:V-type ATP synthase subunit D [Candidatus Omnitrophota bacterium]